MAGLREGSEVDGGHKAKGWQAKRVSGSGESSAASQAVQPSVVGKPNELAESAGESGDRGEAAESEVKSVPKSSVSKMDTGEKSGYVCFGVLVVWCQGYRYSAECTEGNSQAGKSQRLWPLRMGRTASTTSR